MIKVIGENGTKDDWICALSTKLEVSGFGRTRKEALEALKRTLRSTIRVRNKLGL